MWVDGSRVGTSKLDTQDTNLTWNYTQSGAPGETTDFIQPSRSSIAVNRVNSNSASLINGNLDANGNVTAVPTYGDWPTQVARSPNLDV